MRRERRGGGCSADWDTVDVHSSLKTGSALGPIAARVLSIVMNRRKSPLISSS